MNLQIADPCHEDWKQMTDAREGRFCGSCHKVVTDFTGMTNDEISAYLQAHRHESLCGRFRLSQVQEPALARRFSFRILRFAAAAFLIFGAFLFSSCSASVAKAKPGQEKVVMATKPDADSGHLKSFAPESGKKKKTSPRKYVPEDTLHRTLPDQNQVIMGLIMIDPKTMNHE